MHHVGWVGVLAVVGWIGMGGSLQAGRILIDFGTTSYAISSPDPAGRHWNSVGLPSSLYGADLQGRFAPLKLVDEKGAATPLVFAVVDMPLGAFDSGENPQELYPAAAGRDRWSLEKGKDESARFTFTGLDPAKTYDFHFFGVRDAPVSFVSRYTVNGQSVTLAANNNRRNLGSVTGVKPTAAGEVVVDYAIEDGSNAHLSVLEITWDGVGPTKPGEFRTAVAAPPPPPAPPRPTPAPQPVAAPAKPSVPAPSSAPASPAARPAAKRKDSGGKGLLISGIVLLVLGLGVAGFSGYKLFGRK